MHKPRFLLKVFLKLCVASACLERDDLLYRAPDQEESC